MTISNESINSAFQQDMMDMLEEHFEERVVIIEDPETGEQALHKVSGEEISESEFYALSFFEEGWNACLASVERLALEFFTEQLTELYPEEGSNANDTGETDPVT